MKTEKNNIKSVRQKCNCIDRLQLGIITSGHMRIYLMWILTLIVPQPFSSGVMLKNG